VKRQFPTLARRLNQIDKPKNKKVENVVTAKNTQWIFVTADERATPNIADEIVRNISKTTLKILLVAR
jgi:hypothetical protein